MSMPSLDSLPLFSDLHPTQRQAAATLWELRTLADGEDVWIHGEMATEVAIVVSGTLRVHVYGQSVGAVKAGELVGEAAAWNRSLRTASVSAQGSATILVLPVAHLSTLREQYPVLYDGLLNKALVGLANRVRMVDLQIARLAHGDSPSPERKNKGALGKLWQKITHASPQRAPSPLDSLQTVAVLKDVESETLSTIAGALKPRYVPANTPLFLEGDPGEHVFVLAEGCIDVVRHVRGGRGETLANLYPGALFGTGALLLRERRNASCVAAKNTACWVYEMDRSAHLSLQGHAGRVWREALLSALQFQLIRADEQLTRLQRATASTTGAAQQP